MLEYVLVVLAILEVYKSVTLFVFRRRSRTPVAPVREAAPFVWKRGRRVALLIHGFTSSPHELRKLGKLLARNDISVHAPLLPGHGTAPERLAVTKYTEWIEFLEEQIDMLDKQCDEIFLVGNSFGGNLALLLANRSKKIRGIVTLGTPMAFRHERKAKYFLLPVLKRIKMFQKKGLGKYRGGKKRVGAYDIVPLRSVGQLLKVVKMSKKSLGEMKVPVLVMQTRSDTVTDPISAEYIASHVSGKSKVFIVPDSYHVFIMDKHAPVANREILRFVKEFEKTVSK